ncbi:Reticulocyte-binding protein 2 [Carex littledalei]|uniref:Reticulocyte-binding protein 2 n=1 Tax=Carex littledalei TaxID=544730 RepID=A0A833VS89_9POAL|nr:Reticulocyte-binding protein 2 [Carex littledalei]
MDEHKKIDLDAPLLSIRRFSVEPPTSSFTTSNSNSTKQAHKRSSLPFYKPDIKSGPVRNPGVIPFVWEQRPGQPKPSTNSPSRPPFVAPRPPPVKMGSSVRTRKPVTNYSSSAKNVKDPYFEDFNYPNNERLEEKQEQEQIEEEEKFDKPPQVVPESAQAELKSAISNGNHQTQETHKEKQVKEQAEKELKKREQEQKQNEMREKFEEEEEDEDEEDNFSDALDTLSRTESFFMNCSVSGLSELPAGPTKPSPYPGGSDPDAREFMIDRFLPAAQAVATGSPQYTFRKAPVPAREVAKPAQTFVGRGINPSQRRVPVPLPYQNQPKYENSFEEEDEDEEDDDEEEFEESRRFYAKGCGFLPSFCMKGSLLIMNPVPGMKARGKVMPPRGGAGRRSSPLIRSSNNGSDSKHSDEAFENYMHSWEPVYKHKQDQTSNSSMKINDSSKNINSETSHLTYWSDSPNTGGGSSPLIHSTGNSLEKIEYKSSPAVPSHCSSQNRSSSLDRDPDQFLDAQDSNPSEAASATEEVENVVEVKKNGVDWVLPVQLLPLPLPKSPTESWLSRTLPSVSANKQPVSSFLGMQVQNKKQGLRENEMKFSGSPRQIRFSEVLERPASVQSEI